MPSVTSITQTATRRSRLSGAERREQLLDTTKRIAFEQGFHSVSIEAVARAAGVSRPVVYKHFRDLAALLEALVDREGERALGQLHAVLPSIAAADETGEQPLAALRGYLEAVQADPATWTLVLMPQEGAPDVLRERIAGGRAAVIALLAALVARGFGPMGPSPDPELTARTFSALADEGARLILTDPEHFDADRVVSHARWLLSRFWNPDVSSGQGEGKA
jgi:AcrR family transcriptional regulator